MPVAIITGITGQDGAYLSKLLLEKGYEVVGVTRGYSKRNLGKLEYLGISNAIRIEECDLTDFISVFNLLKRVQPDELYNLSAQSSVGLSFQQPIGTIHFNSVSVLNILESIRTLGINTKIYQASSSEMFGNITDLPITLSTAMNPVSPYAISKATAYWTCITYRESYKIFVSNGILFNHESYLRGSNFFIKKIIRESIKIMKGEAQELRVGNIDIKRDFGYAPSYTEAMWLTLQQKEPNDYIICSGKSLTLRAIIYYVLEKLGVSRDVIVEDQELFRPNEIKDIYGDNSKAKKQLSWDYNKSFFDVLDILVEEELQNQ